MSYFRAQQHKVKTSMGSPLTSHRPVKQLFLYSFPPRLLREGGRGESSIPGRGSSRAISDHNQCHITGALISIVVYGDHLSSFFQRSSFSSAINFSI